MHDYDEGVREMFYQLIEGWLTELKDKELHSLRLIPYLILGLFDPDEDLASIVVDAVENIGMHFENENSL